MIISESIEIFNEKELEMNIINVEHNETKRWFYINANKHNDKYSDNY